MEETDGKYKKNPYQKNREKWAKIERGYRKKKQGIPLNEDEKDDYTNFYLSCMGWTDD